MTYAADTPTDEMMKDVIAGLHDAAQREGMDNYDPDRDCPGIIWWRQQKPDTVGAFLDHLKASKEEEVSGWAWTLLHLIGEHLTPELRETLVTTLKEDQAVQFALQVSTKVELTKASTSHLKTICAARYADQPVLRDAVARKLDV